MSHQMHVIYSNFFKGAGMIAGGPYMVAEDSDIFQVDPKEKPWDIAEESIRKLDRKHKHGQGLIEDPSYLHGQPVFVGVLELDNIIGANQQNATKIFYHNVGANLKSEMYPITHHMSSKSN
jgi:hypothetical protein